MSYTDDMKELFSNLTAKPMEALEKESRSRLMAERLRLAQFVLEMTYKYGKTEKEVMDDLEKIMLRYNGGKV